MSDPVTKFTIHVAQREGFEFEATFDKDHYQRLSMDEPPPLGKDSAPNPARILAAAIGDCLCASLVFCAKKSGLALENVTADVSVEIVRNENKRLRIGRIDVEIDPRLPAAHGALASCLELFQDFCIVTESVRKGIEVSVRTRGTP